MAQGPVLTRRMLAALVPFGAFVPLLPACASEAPADTAAIVARMKQDFERPDSRLDVSPVTVVGDWALAGWTQGEMGGRALLRHREGAWVIWLCAGDGIRAAAALRDVGLQPDVADRLASGASAAEAREPPDRIARFARFEGTVQMGAAKP
jgi:hypothetical protein